MARKPKTQDTVAYWRHEAQRLTLLTSFFLTPLLATSVALIPRGFPRQASRTRRRTRPLAPPASSPTRTPCWRSARSRRIPDGLCRGGLDQPLTLSVRSAGTWFGVRSRLWRRSTRGARSATKRRGLRDVWRRIPRRRVIVPVEHSGQRLGLAQQSRSQPALALGGWSLPTRYLGFSRRRSAALRFGLVGCSITPGVWGWLLRGCDVRWLRIVVLAICAGVAASWLRPAASVVASSASSECSPGAHTLAPAGVAAVPGDRQRRLHEPAHARPYGLRRRREPVPAGEPRSSSRTERRSA